MIEKNIIGIYSIKEQYPVFKYTDHDEKRIDPNRYGTERIRDVNISRDTISEHEPINQWRTFSELLKQRKEHDSDDESSGEERTPSHPDRESASQKEAQKRANQAIRARVLSHQAKSDGLQLSDASKPLTNLQHYLSTVQKPVPDEHLKAYEIPVDEEHSFTKVGALKLQDVMTRKVVCMMDETTLEQVASMCNKRRISGMPVLGEDKQLLGLISIKDVIKGLVYGHHDMDLANMGSDILEAQAMAVLQEPVHKFMQRDVVTASPDMPLQEACQLMAYHHIRRLIVTRDGAVKGVFSASDAMRILSQIDLLTDLSEANAV